jgi:succinate-acetate transporter protein
MHAAGDDPRVAAGGTYPAPAARAGEHHGSWELESHESGVGRSRIVLTPVAAPSILGLFGFGGATLMVASLLAGWWGSPVTDAPIIAPFCFFFGGLAQLLAGMWAYRARDAVATAMHGTWGAFWLGWGVLVGFVTLGGLPATVLTSQAFGFWFIVLFVVTMFGALAALADNLGIFTVLGLLAAGAGLLAAGFVGAIPAVVIAGGWVLVAAAVAAFYTAGAMMLANAFGRTVLPLGKYQADASIADREPMRPISYPEGMPGAKTGQ